ncbi:MAG: DUF5050 domain-containing protein [Clostridia bacterium]|nr:DUF5050 domain-containing protein [Clostridia bacterium]
MLKKFAAIILSLAFALSSFAGCGVTKNKEPETTAETTTETTTEETTKGIVEVKFSNKDTALMSNYMNKGRFAFSGSWIYGYKYVNNKAALSKFKQDNSEESVLNLDAPYYINIIDGWVYFLGHKHADKTYAIKKVRLSGDDDTTLVRAKDGFVLLFMFIVDNKIYFCEVKDDSDENISTFCRCDLDGKNRETLMEKAVYYPYVINDCILYQDDKDGEKLHICNMDGSNDRVLIDRHVYRYIVYDSKIYYESADEKYYESDGKKKGDIKFHLRCCKLDGSKDSEFLGVDNVGDFAIINDILYFVDKNDGDRLYFYDFSTESLDLVSQDEDVGFIISLYPSSDILYYDFIEKNGEWYTDHIYVCAPNGTDKRVLAE